MQDLKGKHGFCHEMSDIDPCSSRLSVQVSQHSVHQEEQTNRSRPAVRLRGSGHERAPHGDWRGAY